MPRVLGLTVGLAGAATGFSLMAITMGKTHPLVKAARWYEQRFGKAAYAHLYVPLPDALAYALPRSPPAPSSSPPLLFPHPSTL